MLVSKAGLTESVVDSAVSSVGEIVDSVVFILLDVKESGV